MSTGRRSLTGSRKALAERWHPIIFGFIAALIYLLFLKSYSLPNAIRDLFSAAINICAITVGFLGTSQSILLSIGNKRVIQQLKSGGYYDKLIDYFMTAIHWSFTLAISSAFGLIVNFNQKEVWHPWIISFWLLCLITATFSYYRVIKLFSLILRSSD
ncbi:MAG: hypothetical protein KME25_15935 [Symplocastrum torsivum CPER-KK1]|jgi:hypothetical protein|uniref:Uncharacterized protein n=1 Tax=Symplocastrum torsivum CPER-KK1 TaxID=450513 RepID=A0A951PLS4_9CYAN|nr:hypothetical protein [Symplocastrum torsivum CPER-KK1]